MQVVGNATRRHENFNGVSDKLKKELIKSLNKDEVVHYRLLNGSFDPSLKREVYGASQSIVLRDRIFDPYATNDEGKEVGAYIEIGVPERIVGQIVERCKKYWVESIANGIPGNGQFSLTSSNHDEVEVHEFLCLSNGSKDNKYRDQKKPFRYELVDAKKINAEQADKDLKELKARFARLVADHPEKAEELRKFLPAQKKEEPVTT